MSRTGIHLAVRLGAFAALLALLVLTGGCGTFNYHWKKAAELPAADGMAGRWQGTWTSQATGHTDQLRCIVTKQDGGNYQAQFHAKYHTVMSFGYTVPLQVEKTGDTFKFNGEANLGWMAGGMYKYDGRVEGTNFFSTYTSKADHGTFQMGRP